MGLFTTTFEQRHSGHGSALLAAAEQFLGAKARVKRLVAVTTADERAAAGLLQNKFDFSRLNGRQTRLLVSDFPQLRVRGGLGRRKRRVQAALEPCWLHGRAGTERAIGHGLRPALTPPPWLPFAFPPPQYYDRPVFLSRDLSSSARAAHLKAATARETARAKRREAAAAKAAEAVAAKGSEGSDKGGKGGKAA
jgi:hypothetical protein